MIARLWKTFQNFIFKFQKQKLVNKFYKNFIDCVLGFEINFSPHARRMCLEKTKDFLYGKKESKKESC
ncbi:hypothetical protein COX27_02335 [Candidatus Kuenenbacteria bacterium CG23_combo_of_CG06-09_8_20_14_all_36_9]|uniref:Uncharacterized protein n=1 Tax=Candidatus Kuenenbacteria bacterium CG10_big_fil_rev_8_21_14_0_10_36_11 TaxID=1974618 RepID=A0A2M6W9M6_9BACT|nr:MAG: hypothetical protein COX27_02335 [Candidatus Kuenenbacteria bacterium CG23_combo_of_CG06-09_8_20_14_all_36_9]PIT89500.1 MAG: hypothetical protein COU23_03595 [Candidatus Kuenenbacteria bacterium CG10_big_fil_rev_8_21_14_0_10_36_11]